MNLTMEYIVKVLTVIVGIILALLAWVRFRPKDKAEVDNIASQTKKLEAEADKVRAETEEKNTASAKAVNDMVMGLVNRLDEELSHEKETNAKLQLRLEQMAEEIRTLQAQLSERNKELELARLELKILRDEYGKQ